MKRLLINDVTSLTRKLCDLKEGIQHEVLYVGVTLKDKEELKKYLTVIVCPVDEIHESIESIKSQNGCNLEDYTVPSNYCHITTFENNMPSISQISFDKNDDLAIKAKINHEYEYIDIIFQRFLEYHSLFENDLYKYIETISKGFHPSKENNSSLKKRK